MTKVCQLPLEGLTFPLKKDYERVNRELFDPRIVDDDYEAREEAKRGLTLVTDQVEKNGPGHESIGSSQGRGRDATKPQPHHLRKTIKHRTVWSVMRGDPGNPRTVYRVRWSLLHEVITMRGDTGNPRTGVRLRWSLLHQFITLRGGTGNRRTMYRLRWDLLHRLIKQKRCLKEL